MKKNRLQAIIEGAIIAALAMALSYIPHSTGVSSIEILYGAVPLIIYSWRRGFKYGILAGFVWGTLNLMLRGLSNGGVLNVWQGLLEYPVAFALLGLAGLWSKPIKRRIANHQKIAGLLFLSGGFAVAAKYVIHFFAGVLVWGAYAPKSMNPWIYSLIVNGGSAVASMLFAIIVIGLLKKMVIKFIKVN